MSASDVAVARCLECRTVAAVALLGDSAICEACLRAGLEALEGGRCAYDDRHAVCGVPLWGDLGAVERCLLL